VVYRIFLSSPSDVTPERAAVRRAVDRINAERAPEDWLETVQWEEHHYTADSTFQDQIPSAAACDVVLVILWRGLGSPLPKGYRRPDGTLPTGTEYEFEEALDTALNNSDRVPSLFVFRRGGEIWHPESQREESQRQYDMLERFWTKWFRNEEGHFVAAFNWFDDTDDFELRAEAALRGWLRDREGARDWGGVPYKGLAAFDIEDAPIFFGRRDEVARARARFLANAKRGHRALFVLGPSGSGKSSILRAGLLPQLTKLGGNKDLVRLDRFGIATPSGLAGGGDPFLGLAKAFLEPGALGAALREGDFATAEDLAEILKTDGASRVAPIRAALRRAQDGGGAQGFVLVLDQFEEIFAWPEPLIAGFAEALRALTAETDVFLVCAMRAEFQSKLADHPALNAMANPPPVAGSDAPIPTLHIQPPNAADSREMIRGPARKAGLTFEGATADYPDLAARIEAETGPDSLPALQFLLRELYEMRQDTTLTHAAFDRLGGIAGVMARRGEGVMAQLSAKQRAGFPALVRLLVDTRSFNQVAVARSCPHETLAGDPVLAALAKALGDARLLVSDAHGVRLAHESLIAGWGQLRSIVDDERRYFALREYLVAVYRRFEAARETSARAARQVLLRGLPLTEALSLRAVWGDAPLAAVAAGLPDFIARSRRARLYRLLRAGAVALAGCAAVAGFVWTLSQLETERGLIAGRNALEAGQYDEAVAAALAGLDRAPGVESLSFAAEVLREVGIGRLDLSPDASIQAIAPATADGTGGFVTLDREGRVIGSGAARSLTLDAAVLSSVTGMAQLADGRLVLIARSGDLGEVGPDGSVRWLELPIGPVTRAGQWAGWIGPSGSVFALADGGPDPSAAVRCPAERACALQRPLPAGSLALGYSADGQRLAVALQGGGLVMVGPGEDRDQAVIPDLTPISVAVLGEDRVVAGQADGQAFFVENGRAVPLPLRASGQVFAAQPLIRDPTGTRIAVRCGPQVICAGPPEGPVRLHFPAQADLLDLVWSDARGGLASTAFSGQAVYWSAQAVSGFGLPQGMGEAITALAVGDAAMPGLIVGDRSGGVSRLSADGRRVWQHDVDATEITSVALGSDGQAAAATSFGAFAVFDREGDMAVCSAPEQLQRVAIGPDGRAYATSSRALYRHEPGARCARLGLLAGDDLETLGGLVVTERGAVLTSRSDGAVTAWAGTGDDDWTAQTFASLTDSASALSLAVSPDGRWLATTRSDDTIALYPADDGGRAVQVAMPPGESKTVAFAPDGRHLAVLGASDWLRVLRFDPDSGATSVLVDLPIGVPGALLAAGAARQTGWIAWADADHLVLGTAAGDLVALPVTAEAIDDRLRDTATRLTP
jgi:hypothetical protein